MNTNPSQRTEQGHIAGASRAMPPKTDNNRAKPEATQDRESRTFQLSLASLYELWQVVTFMGWAGDGIQMSPVGGYSRINAKLTVRPGTLEAPEFHWLVEHFFVLDAGTASLHLTATQSALLERHPRLAVLTRFAEQVHKYLDMHDVAAMLEYLNPQMDKAHLDVATRTIPGPQHDLERFKEHLRICMNCIRLSYVDDSFAR